METTQINENKNNEPTNQKVYLGRLYINKTTKGQTYINGTINGLKIVAFEDKWTDYKTNKETFFYNVIESKPLNKGV